mmetsp:Transcript_14232/g.46730  ORF Transcript_14232/g.46730 Transcript_14232/m.46730 type:complete len:738 (-) Transcript_14232:52-2265(-)
MTGPANPEVAVAALLKDLSPTELASLVGKLEEERKRYAKAEELVEAEIAEARTSLGEGAPPTPTREGFVVVDGDDTVSTLQSAVRELGKGLVEREEEVRLVLLAALTGEHLLLLGPPGTAKSELGRRLSACFGSGAYFERLLTKFSTPEELFGPVSIKGLERDVYERKSEGYLPQASFAFVDEIFKANSAILNTLLTLLNERVFHNGTAPTPCPLVCLIGASNELPESEELEALYDRFLIRAFVSPVSRERFGDLLLSEDIEDDHDRGQNEAVLDVALIEAVRRDAESVVSIPARVLGALRDLRRRIKEALPAAASVVSDRRWRKCARLLRVVAAAHGRTAVALDDLMVLRHCLWCQPSERGAAFAAVKAAVAKAAKGDDAASAETDAPLAARTKESLSLAIRTLSAKDALRKGVAQSTVLEKATAAVSALCETAVSIKRKLQTKEKGKSVEEKEKAAAEKEEEQEEGHLWSAHAWALEGGTQGADERSKKKSGEDGESAPSAPASAPKPSEPLASDEWREIASQMLESAAGIWRIALACNEKDVLEAEPERKALSKALKATKAKLTKKCGLSADDDEDDSCDKTPTGKIAIASGVRYTVGCWTIYKESKSGYVFVFAEPSGIAFEPVPASNGWMHIFNGSSQQTLWSSGSGENLLKQCTDSRFLAAKAEASKVKKATPALRAENDELTSGNWTFTRRGQSIEFHSSGTHLKIGHIRKQVFEQTKPGSAVMKPHRGK